MHQRICRKSKSTSDGHTAGGIDLIGHRVFGDEHRHHANLPHEQQPRHQRPTTALGGRLIRTRQISQSGYMLLLDTSAVARIVMNDVRYTNFDVRVYWKTQAFQYTNFHDVPDGIADKITIFPEPEQWNELRALIPPDFDISISEGVMWMLMNPQANKEHALRLLCDRLDVPLEQTAAFGDDLIDINMMSESGRGVAVANANPKVLSIADEICPPNNEDGVAQWIESQLR